MDSIFVLTISFLLGGVISFVFIKIFTSNKKNDLAELIDLSEKIKLEELNEQNLNLIKELQEKSLEFEGVIKVNGEELGYSDQKNDEIEELEDEISSLKKKIKRIYEDRDNLDKKVFEIQKEAESYRDERDLIQQDIRKYISEVEIKKNKIQQQKDSLNLINGILNAPNSNNTEFVEISFKSRELLSFIENELVDSLNLDEVFLEECWVWRNQQIKTWIDRKKVIAIVGEFSAGKTSIVNRILTQDDPKALELPVNSKETTAIPTYISYGSDFYCQFFSPEGELKSILPKTFQMVNKSILDEVNISSLVKYFVLSYNNQNLINYSILDTPGFGSNSEDIIRKTTNVIKEADVLFWVLDCNTGELNSSSIKVIKESLKGVPFCVILNKADTKSPRDLELLVSKVKSTLEKNEIAFKELISFHHKDDVNKLFQIINKIDLKEHKNVIYEINSKFRNLQDGLRLEIEQLRIKEKQTYKHLENDYSSIDNLIQESITSIEDCQELFSFKSSFWSEDYFKIKNSDYKTYQSLISKANDSIKEIPDYFKKITERDDDLKEIINDISNNKDALNELGRKKREFDKLSEEYKEFKTYGK